jgi:hypothetical protein
MALEADTPFRPDTIGATMAKYLISLHLTRPEAAQITLDEARMYGLLESFLGFAGVIGATLAQVAKLPPSGGYEPYLVDRGLNPIAARGIAAVVDRSAERTAREGAGRRAVIDAIRFLAHSKRQNRAIILRARALLKNWERTSLVDTIFAEAAVNETEFIALLKLAVDGGEVAGERIREMAAAVLPNLSIARGPKISAPSVAHELFVEEFSDLPKKRRPHSGDRSAEYVDAMTEATRLEFNVPDFDARSVRRRRLRQAAKTPGVARPSR